MQTKLTLEYFKMMVDEELKGSKHELDDVALKAILDVALEAAKVNGR